MIKYHTSVACSCISSWSKLAVPEATYFFNLFDVVAFKKRLAHFNIINRDFIVRSEEGCRHCILGLMCTACSRLESYSLDTQSFPQKYYGRYASVHHVLFSDSSLKLAEHVKPRRPQYTVADPTINEPFRIKYNLNNKVQV